MKYEHFRVCTRGTASWGEGKREKSSMTRSETDAQWGGIFQSST